jgi:hypothetical protein
MAKAAITLRILAAAASAVFALAAGGQPVDLYRHTLGADMPESPAGLTLDLTPTQVWRGSAPPPLAAALATSSGWRHRRTGLALEFTPAYLIDDGARDLSRYRRNSLGGRLERVLTKTALSIALAREEDAAPIHVAAAVRATFHDPHDPVLNSDLPERLAAAGATEAEALLRASSVAMRARGGVLISGGWAARGRLDGGVAAGDSLRDVHHLIFGTAQWILGPRADLLTTIQYRRAFRDDATWRLGLGWLRKSGGFDLLLEAAWDTRAGALYPAVTTTARVLPRLEIQAALGAVAADSSEDTVARARAALAVRWFLAQDS